MLLSMMSVLAAQDVSPAAVGGLADLGLPALEISVTTAGYEGIPESLDAGRSLVTLTADEDIGEFGGSIKFAQPMG